MHVLGLLICTTCVYASPLITQGIFIGVNSQDSFSHMRPVSAKLAGRRFTPLPPSEAQLDGTCSFTMGNHGRDESGWRKKPDIIVGIIQELKVMTDVMVKKI